MAATVSYLLPIDILIFQSLFCQYDLKNIAGTMELHSPGLTKSQNRLIYLQKILFANKPKKTTFKLNYSELNFSLKANQLNENDSLFGLSEEQATISYPSLEYLQPLSIDN